MWGKLFGRGKKAPPEDVLGDLSPAGLQPGWLVDYDLQTWRATARHLYDWGQGDVSIEWRLENGDQTLFLEMEQDDEPFWSLNAKIPFSRLDPSVMHSIQETEDPPREIVFEGETYYLEETAGGYYLKNGQKPGREMLRWSYSDEEGTRFLGIEQWGEDEFEASTGFAIKEYQLTNILPGKLEP
jgi:hypothetical protein